jgi:hypothetical protein
MECIQSPLPISNLSSIFEFEFFVIHDDFGAMVAYTPYTFQNDIKEALVIDRSRKFDMPKISWIGVTVYISHAWVVYSPVYRLTIDGGFVSCNPSWDFT